MSLQTHRAARATDMQTLEADITLDPLWLAQNTDRLLAFEVLHRTLTAQYQPMNPGDLADKVGVDKGFSYEVLKAAIRSIDAN